MEKDLVITLTVENQVKPEPYPVESERVGCTIGDFLGTVDEDGTYVEPNSYNISADAVVVDLSGIKRVNNSGFESAFYFRPMVKKVIADDLVEVGNKAFQNCFADQYVEYEVSFGSLEEIPTSAASCFGNAFASRFGTPIVRFPKLKRVMAASAFQNAFNRSIQPDDVFPVLEEVSGNQVFYNFRSTRNDDVIRFSAVKKITGATSGATNATFVSFNSVIWEFPSVEEITGIVFYSSGAKEIHFAASNKEKIEACDGFDTKWGGTNATIYFDL